MFLQPMFTWRQENGIVLFELYEQNPEFDDLKHLTKEHDTK